MQKLELGMKTNYNMWHPQANLCLINFFFFLQVRSSLFELARRTKFNLCRHIVVTLILLVIINLLVIFIPSMKDIFGVVGTVF